MQVVYLGKRIQRTRVEELRWWNEEGEKANPRILDGAVTTVNSLIPLGPSKESGMHVRHKGEKYSSTLSDSPWSAVAPGMLKPPHFQVCACSARLGKLSLTSHMAVVASPQAERNRCRCSWGEARLRYTGTPGCIRSWAKNGARRWGRCEGYLPGFSGTLLQIQDRLRVCVHEGLVMHATQKCSVKWDNHTRLVNWILMLCVPEFLEAGGLFRIG